MGDLDASLYLLFRTIRGHSTVALSGESADEVFGGYPQFFDPQAQQASTFPWLVRFLRHFTGDNAILVPGLREALDLPRYVQDAYDTSVARIERLPGESDFEWRLRKICYLHLTHFVRILLDRKENAREYLSSPRHPAFDIVNRDWLARAAAAEARATQESRHGLERALDLAMWLDMYKPVLKLS